MARDEAHRALKNSLFMFVRMVVVLLIGLYTSRVVLHMLGFEDYGIYNVVGSVVLFFSFLNTALMGATSRYLTYELGTGHSDKLNLTFSTAILAHVLLAVAMVVLLEAGGIWFVNHKLNIAPERMTAANVCFQLSVLSMAVNVMAVPFGASIIAHEHMNYYALVSIVEAVLKLAIVFTLALLPTDKLIAYSALILVVTIIVRVCYALYCRLRLKDCRFECRFDAKLLGQLATFSGYSLFTSSADGITMQCRNIFFNWFAGVLANAAMGIANQVLSVLNGFVDAFTQAVKPQIVKSYASGDRAYFMRLIFSSTKMNYLLFLLISLPVILNLEFLLDLWLVEYPPYTIPFIQAITFFMVFDMLQQPLWTAIHATGRIKCHEILMSGIKILAIPATYWALKYGYSPVVTLYIWAGLNVLCAVVRTLYAHYAIQLSVGDYLGKVILPLLIVTLLVAPLPWWLASNMEEGWLQLLVTGSLCVVLIVGIGYFVGLDKKERDFVLGLGPVRTVINYFWGSKGRDVPPME